MYQTLVELRANIVTDWPEKSIFQCCPSRAYSTLPRLLDVLRSELGRCVVPFEDDPKTTKQDVLDLLDKSLSKAKNAKRGYIPARKKVANDS